MKTPSKPTSRQEHWLSHLRRAQALKLPLAQYCRARGLKVQSLYNARHEQSGKRRRAGASGRTRAQASVASRFVAVELASLPSPEGTRGAACRIQLREVVIECASLPEAAWLSALARGAGDALP
jgi:hypothetical protein